METTQAAQPALEMRNYTQAIVEALMAVATGERSNADSTGAMEVAAGYWSRAFASAVSTPAMVPQHMLAHIGRSLCRKGESLWYIDVKEGAVQFLPVTAHDVRGGADPDTWRYDIQMGAPTNLSTLQNVSGSQIVHCRYAYNTEHPWRGVAPLTFAADAAIAMGLVELRGKEEAGTTTGYLLPIPQRPTNPQAEGSLLDPLTPLRLKLQSLAGGLAITESMSQGWGEGRQASPPREWQPQRLGSNPPEGLLELRRDMQDVILAACGVPPALARGDGQASQSNREAWRQFLYSTINPVAILVAEELTTKLNAQFTLNFDRLFASDIQGRARAFQAMVLGGMEVERAAILSGLITTPADDNS